VHFGVEEQLPFTHELLGDILRVIIAEEGGKEGGGSGGAATTEKGEATLVEGGEEKGGEGRGEERWRRMKTRSFSMMRGLYPSTSISRYPGEGEDGG